MDFYHEHTHTLIQEIEIIVSTKMYVQQSCTSGKISNFLGMEIYSCLSLRVLIKLERGTCCNRQNHILDQRIDKV